MTMGIVRRIDNLGRIVIPKEIRKKLKVNEGDSLEIFIDNDYLILKKYLILNNFLQLSNKLVDSFYNIYKKNLIITDNEKVIVTSKKVEFDYKDKYLSSKTKDNIFNRIEKSFSDSIIINGKNENHFLVPLINNGDLIGSIILLESDIDDNLKSIIKFLSEIILKNIEE